MQPHYSHSSRENATPSSGTSPLASCKGVAPRAAKVGEILDLPPPPLSLSLSRRNLIYPPSGDGCVTKTKRKRCCLLGIAGSIAYIFLITKPFNVFKKQKCVPNINRPPSSLTHNLQCQEYSQFNRSYRKRKKCVLFLWPEIERLVTFFKIFVSLGE